MHKKIYHILSAALLLFATTGTGISKHYCGEFWVSTSIYGEGDTCCNNSNCCHTENQFFQVEDDFSAPGFSQIPLVVDLNLLACLLEQESRSSTRCRNPISVYNFPCPSHTNKPSLRFYPPP